MLQGLSCGVSVIDGGALAEVTKWGLVARRSSLTMNRGVGLHRYLMPLELGIVATVSIHSALEA